MPQRDYIVELFSNAGYPTWKQILEVFDVKPPEITSLSLGEVVAKAVERQVSVWKTYGPFVRTDEIVYTKEIIEDQRLRPNILTKRIIKKRLSVGYVQLSRKSIIYNIESRNIREEYWPKDVAIEMKKPDRDFGEKVKLRAIYPDYYSRPSPQVKHIIDDLPFMSKIGQQYTQRLCHFPLHKPDEPNSNFKLKFQRL